MKRARPRLAPSRAPRRLPAGTWLAAAVLLGAACIKPLPGVIMRFRVDPVLMDASGGVASVTWQLDGIPTSVKIAVSPSAGVTIGSKATPATSPVELGNVSSVKVNLPKNTGSSEITYHFTLSAKFKEPTSSDTATDSVMVQAPGPGNTGTPGSTTWLTQFGSAGDDAVTAMAYDHQGHIGVVGFTTGDLGGAVGAAYQPFVALLDDGGSVKWVKAIGSAPGEATAVAFDQNGNLFVAGDTTGDFALANAGGDDVFVASYDATGAQRWSDQFGSANEDLARGLAVDDNGAVFVTGLYGSGSGSGTLFLSRFDTNGAQSWTKDFGSATTDEPHGIAVDVTGNIAVVGETSGDFAGTNAGQQDAFIATFDASGTPSWTRQLGSAGDDVAFAVAAGVGDFVLTGQAGGDLGGTGSGDLFLAAYDPLGNRSWLTQLGTAGDTAYAVATDAGGDIAIAGATTGALGQANAGSYDAFAGRFDGSGHELWTSQLGTPADDRAFAVTTGQLGAVFVAGSTTGTLGQKSFGQTDAFVAALAP